MPVPTRPFGRTGHDSTRVIFGAAALGGMSEERAAATLDRVRAAGLNHIDTASGYGASEDRLAPFLARHRSEVFLATKARARRGDDARAELERSLERMGVDHVDLIQLHNLVEDDEWETAFASGGAVEALARARDEGLAGAVGVTGHGLRIPGMHLRSLERFDFASVLVPYSPVLVAIDSYRADVDRLREVCAERGVAVQTIKSIARRRWRPDADDRKFAWYEPLRDAGAIERAMRFVLAEDDLFLNTSSDATLLDHALALAGSMGEQVTAPTADELAADEAAFGIESLFDGGVLETI